MSKLVELFKGGMWLTLAEISAKLTSALSLPVLARVIGPESLGIYSIIFTLILTAKELGGLGVGLSIHRNGAQYKTIGSEAVGRLFSAGFILIFSGSAVLALVVWFLQDAVAQNLLGNAAISPFLLSAAILIVLQPLSEVPLIFLAALHQFRSYATQSSIAAILTNAVPLVAAWKLGLSGAILGLIIASILRIAFSYSIVRPVLKANEIAWRLDSFWRETKLLLEFGLPYYLGNTLLGSIVSLPLLGLVSRYAGLDEVGYIRVATSMAALMGFVPMAIAPAVISHLSANSGESSQSKIMKMAHFRVIWSLALVLNGGICLILPQLVGGLYGLTYRPATPLAWIHLWLTMLACVSTSLGQYLLADGKTGKICKSNALGIVSTVVAAYLLVPQYGAMGYLIAQIVGQVLLIAVTIRAGILSRVSKADLLPIRNLCFLTVLVFVWTSVMFYIEVGEVARFSLSLMSVVLILVVVTFFILHASERSAIKKKMVSKYL